MFVNYLKTAFRSIKKTKMFSLINVLGLAIGMTACLLILYYVSYEKSFDRFHQNADRIYRLRYERIDEKGDAVRFASCCPPAAARIRGNYPEIEKIGRLLNYKAVVSYQDIKFIEEKMFFVEPEFLEVLQFPFVKGDPLSGIKDPGHAFISQSMARKYFGDQDPLGKTFSVDKHTDYEITGIFNDFQANSHLKIDIMLPWKNLEAQFGPDYYEAWGHTGSYTYLLVKPGTDPKVFEEKLQPLIKAECPWLEEYKMVMNLPMQPLLDIHLNSHFMQEYEANGNRDTVNFLMIIAIFIIVMAWVNYINLSTARSLNRAKEVGLRKVVGASKQQLMIQFFFETILINFISILVTFGLIELTLPFFRQITAVPTGFPIWTAPWFWLAVVAMFLFGVFLSGLYPVIVMTSFDPVKVLKGKLGNGAKKMNLRKALVIFQYVMALALMTATITVFQQLSFMRHQDLGFNIDHTLVVSSPRVRDDMFNEKFDIFKETLSQMSDINKICSVTEVPGRQIYWDNGGIKKAGEDDNKSKNYQIVGVDYDFADVFDLKFVAGRNFSRDFPSDKKALVFNETAINWMGFDSPEDAIGKQVDYWGEIFTIIGVLKDYHQQSLKVAYEPHIYRFMPYGRGNRGVFAIKINSYNIPSTVDLVQKKYIEFFPGNPFEYFFLDDYFNQQYKSDELLGRVFSLFSTLAMIITALGIFGLSAFSAVQRTKEIAIRKVLGASVNKILAMLIRDFLGLLFISFVLVVPGLFYGLNYWLSSFANRMTLNPWLFIIPVVVVGLITTITVVSQTIRAATVNPVNSLNYE